MAHSPPRYLLIQCPLCEPFFTNCFLFVIVYNMHQLLPPQPQTSSVTLASRKGGAYSCRFLRLHNRPSLCQRLASTPERQSAHICRCTVLEAPLSPRNLPFPFRHII